MLMHERIRIYRKELGLSQEYIGSLLKVPRTTITVIESGERNIKADELKQFSEIFGVSSDEILNGKPTTDGDVQLFTNEFSSLSETDKKEITNLIEFNKIIND